LLLQHLEAEGRLELDAALTIMIRGRELTAREPNMLEIGTPVTIVGDIHGQFFDMVCTCSFPWRLISIAI
jgi:serine/threonine-protein phosphatase 2B catalytic subunit